MPIASVTVSGSFDKHYGDVIVAIDAFASAGVQVLAPKRSRLRNPGEQFPLLESDATSDPRTLETMHLNAIRDADLLYVVNPTGYSGVSVAFEIGWALALGKIITAQVPFRDTTIRQFCDAVGTPEEILRWSAQRNAPLGGDWS